MHRRYLAALLVLSGFCGLSYELIWVRMLSLSFGSTTLSFSTVIAVFLGGLALGSWLCGRSARALASPVKAYAYLELATGVIGLLLYPVLRALPELFSHVDPGPGAGGLLVRLLVAILVLLPPTLLMGATLPVACAACIHDDAKLGSGTATLYGINTLGACLGTYGVTFQLFPTIGLDGAVYFTAALNFVVGAVVLACERAGVDVAVAASVPVARPADATPATVDDVSSFVAGLALTTGFAAVGTQVVWSRLFSTVLEGTIYGVGSVLVAILVGIGVGSVVVGRWLETREAASLGFVVSQAIVVLSLCAMWACVPLIQYAAQSLAPGLTGSALVHAQLLVVIVSLFLPAAASGASLPILVRVVETRAAGVPGALSRLYAANTIGSVVGSLVCGFIALPVLGTPSTAYATTILSALTGAIAAVRLLRTWGPARLVVAGVVVGSVAAFPNIDAARTLTPVSPGQSFWAHAESAAAQTASLVYFNEGRVATVAVTERGSMRGLSLNGLGQGGYSVEAPNYLTESLLVAQIPMSHAPRLEAALVVGLGAGATVDVLTRVGVDYVRVLELEPAVVDAANLTIRRDFLVPPSVDVVIDDARHHLLMNRRAGRRFDLITSMPAHPWIAASIFTREFFTLAKDNLTPDGVFTTWFGGTRLDEPLFDALYSAFVDVFPNHIVYEIPEVGALYLVGSAGPLTFDPARFARAVSPEIIGANDLALDDPTFFATRVLTSGAGAHAREAGTTNTDANMFAEVRAPMIRTSTVNAAETWVTALGLDPELIPAEARVEVTLDTLEALLGTPDGRVPYVPAQPKLRRARGLLDRARGVLPAEAVAYFEARIKAAARPPDLTALATVAGSTTTWGARAAAFRAVLEPNVEARRALIASLVESGRAGPDVWVRATGEARTRAAELGAERWRDGDRSALTWMLVMGSTTDVSTVAPSAGALRALGRLAAGTGSADLLELCVRAAARTLQVELELRCRSGSTRLRRAEANQKLAEARRAGAARKFDEALGGFDAANALEPLDRDSAEMYLATAIYARSAEAERLAVERLRLLGVSEPLIEARRAAAVAKRGAMSDSSN